MKDNLGILFPLASLPGRHGIGDFGKPSFDFVKWLAEHGFRYWQVLPLNPIGPGNSPYMSTCSNALETRYISLDELVKDELLNKVPNHKPNVQKINYMDVYYFKEKYLYRAYKKFMKKPFKGYQKFKKDNPWLVPYAIFLSLRIKNNYVVWNRWSKADVELASSKKVPHGYEDIVEYESFKQFIAFRQWDKVRKLAKKMGITIIADCPFYVGIDSIDCLLNKEQFLLDDLYHPTVVSGCPPDAFSDDGQLWGTPIYDFKKMREDKYTFLIERLAGYMKTCDKLRLDHFRAFDTYCVIPAQDSNARRGKWENGPAYDFFDELYRRYPNINLIAEDLGDLFPSVLELRDHYNLPGMYIVEFTIFDKTAMSTDKQIVYPGTHDNQTLLGWLKTLPEENVKFLKVKFGEKANLFDAVFKYILSLPSMMTIFQYQDLLKLDDKARINYPGTVGDHNWSFKIKKLEKNFYANKFINFCKERTDL